jgi:hypothetical protein
MERCDNDFAEFPGGITTVYWTPLKMCDWSETSNYISMPHLNSLQFGCIGDVIMTCANA